MNKTLSLIEEEEEFNTNNEEDEFERQSRLRYSITKDSAEEMFIDPIGLPDIVKDIESMEREFTRFLEFIYN